MTRPVPYIDPARPTPKRQPLKAWSHMQKLIADKEDTAQVFYIIQALNGNSSRKDFKRFLSTPSGIEMLKRREFLPDILDNHDEIAKLPAGTVGRTYMEFMQREGLSAAGLVAESEMRGDRDLYDDDLLWYYNRLRDTHDLEHVLTGYGRDAMGEASLLRYSYSQGGGMGVNFIAFMGAREVAKYAPKGVSIPAVAKEAKRNGKAAARVIDQDIPALLREPIEDARERMNIREPALYKQALRRFQEDGTDPQLVAA
ncbi:MAG: Coq4 family protein [Pseudomonadota bacterium]